MQVVCVAVHETQAIPDTPQYARLVPELQTPVGVQHPVQFVSLQTPPSTATPASTPGVVVPPSAVAPPDEPPPPPPGGGPGSVPPVVSTGGRDGLEDEHAPMTPAASRMAPAMEAETFIP
jgi:hypothetical protein